MVLNIVYFLDDEILMTFRWFDVNRLYLLYSKSNKLSILDMFLLTN